jgi:hypothetical protein
MLGSFANTTLSLNFLGPPILRRRLNNMMQQPVSKIRTNNKEEYHGDGDFVEHGWSAVVLKISYGGFEPRRGIIDK